MSRASIGVSILFWGMALTGGVGLTPCLILPPWLEYQGKLAERSAAEQNVAELDRRLAITRKKIAHLKNDPAYVERLARKELGIATPGFEAIRLELPAETGEADRRPSGTALDPANLPPDASDVPPPEDELAPAVSAVVGDALERYPIAQIFVHDSTRPYVMAMSAALLLAAVVFLGVSSRSKPDPVEPS